MTRTRLVLCLALIGAMGACGGRSGLHPLSGDSGAEQDSSAGSRLDGHLDGVGQDSRLDSGLAPDASGVDVATPGAGVEVGLPEVRAEVGAPDVRVDVALPDARAEVGGPDVRDAAVPDVARPEAGRPEVRPPVDAGGAGDLPVLALSSLEISPASPRVVVGTGLSVVITAVYNDSSTADVSSSATVTSNDTSIVSVSSTLIKGVKAGTTTITAAYQGKTATATVTVVDTVLQSISIQSVAPLPVGQQVNLVATGVFADGSKQDVTAVATWTSSSAAIATVGDTGTSKGQVTGVAPGTATMTASLAGVNGKVDVTVVAKKITGIAITPPQPILQRGVTQAFQATATYDDASTGDVTEQATWASGDASILTVVATGASAGLATAVGAGKTTITATLNGTSGTASVTVTTPTLTSIVVSPATATIFVGATSSFTAKGSYLDGTSADLTDSVTWTSSATTVVSISNAAGSRGQATALAVGTANIQAALSGVTGTAAVTVSAQPLVSIAVTPNPLSLPLGLTLPLKATATYGDKSTADVTASATWTVKDGSIATVGNVGSAAGQVTGAALGSTTVTATLSGISGSATVNVASPKLVSITVAPATAKITAGQTQAFTATGNYDNSTTLDVTTQVTWSSSNTAVAQVSNAAGSNGVATSLIAGTATITATLSGVKGTATLTAGEPALVTIMVTPATANIAVGATQRFTVTGVYANGTTTTTLAGVTWTSSATGVATVRAAGGGGGGGAAAGIATAVAAGSTTITATYTSGTTSLSDTASLSVTAPKTLTGIRITPTSSTIRLNATQAYVVYGDYDDGTSAELAAGVTLTTSDGTVAAVAGGGGGGFGGGLVVNGAGAGSATVTATYQKFSAKATITVLAPTPIGFYITPATGSVRVGDTLQFAGMVTYDDGTSAPVTGSVAWTTSNGATATISNAGGGRGGGGGGGGGLATGVAGGTVTIKGTYTTFSDTATLTVTAPVLKSLVVTPAKATIQLNQTQAFQAAAVYDDGSSVTVTGSATWSSSDPTIAVMNTAGGGRGGPGAGVGGGTATALLVGSATISASYTENGVTVSATASLTVTDPPLLSVEISPTNPTVSLLNPNQAFVATAIYSDYSTRTVTTSATWTSSNGPVATVSTSGGTIGRATGLTAGSTIITAAYGGMSASTTLTVTTKKVTSIQVTPTKPTAVLGINQPFVATAVYDDSSTGTVTGAATWTSSDPTVATVGNAGGTTGVATPVKAGPTTITANYQGVSGSTLLTVSGAKLASIAITPSPLSVVVGARQQLTATGTWDDKSTLDITADVTWLSQNGDAGGDAIATVSNATGSRGLFTAVSAGSVTVSAIFQGVTGAETATVTASP